MDNQLSSMCSLSLEMFTVIKQEYSIYLDDERIKFIDELDINNFYKFIDDETLPQFFYLGNAYYINKHYNLNIIEYVPFLCLSSLCPNLNPLKIGLIEEELEYLNEKYNLNIRTLFNKELEVGKIITSSILSNVPYKVIFKESDVDIVNYLNEECGSKTGLFYFQISKMMKDLRKNNNFNDDINYQEIIDLIYDFISAKVRV